MKKIFTLILFMFPFTALSSEQEQSFDLDDEFNDINFQSILTSTKLKTSRQDAPVSITKITAEQIARNKYRNIPEALRSVPGMVVVETHTTQLMYAVGYHGGNATVPRRMNVLIDGVSFYQPGFARVRWEILPVDMNNIYSIEVIRGPAASLYGSNSFTSVVNITTKTPQQTAGKINELGFFSNVFVGDGGVLNTTLRLTHLFNKTGVNLTYTHKEDDGFDSTSTGEERRDSKLIDNVVLQINHEINTNQSINFTLSSTNEDVQEQFVAPVQTSFPDYKVNAYFAAFTYLDESFKDHNLQIKGYAKHDKLNQSWNARVPAMSLSPEMSLMYDMNSTYAMSLLEGKIPTGGSSSDDIQAYNVLRQVQELGAAAFSTIDAIVFQNYTEKQYKLEIQDTHKYSYDLRFIIGASIEYATATNYDWIISSPQSLLTKRVFGNVEYSLSDNWLMNAGASFEHDDLSGGSLAPRLAFNNHTFDDYSFRFIVSTAERTPDTFEQKANWRYTATNLSSNPFNNDEKLTYFVKAVAKGNLVAEKITSCEVGMLFEPKNSELSLDIRLFYEDQTSLIDEKITIFDFNLTNNGEATIKGAEFELSYQLNHSTLFNASYSYTNRDTKGGGGGIAESLSVKSTFYTSLNHQINDLFSVNIYYYGLSHFLGELEHNFNETVQSPSFDLFDANIAYKQPIPNFGEFELSLHLRHRNTHTEFEADNFYDESNAYFLNASLTF